MLIKAFIYFVASNASLIAGIINGIEQLNGSNYATWKEKLEITLALLNIDYAFLNDPPEAPKEGVENYDALKWDYDDAKIKWEDSNRKCLMIIKGSITQSMRGAIPDSQSAKAYLGKIEDHFKRSSKIYATSLIRRLIDERYDPTGSLREHIMRKINMAAKLKTMEMEISEGFLVHFIVSSLPQEFSPFTINYNAMDAKWGIDEMMARCVQEEERLKAERIDHINQFKHSQKKKYHKFVNEYIKPKPSQFKNKGQSSKQCQQKKQEKTPNADANVPEGCRFCGKSGHIQKDCIGFMRWLNKKGTDSITFIDESLYINYATNTWWVDSGATIHVANSLQGFDTRRTLRRGERTIRVANGVEANAEAIGEFTLVLHSGFMLRLHDVLYVPSMRRNLVSVSCLADDGYHCNFGNKRCIIMCDNEDVGLAFRQDKLYLVSLSDSINDVCPSSNINIGTKHK